MIFVGPGNPRVPLGLFSSNYSDTTLRHETGETSALHFHQLTTLRVDTNEEIVGSKAIPSRPLIYVYTEDDLFS